MTDETVPSAPTTTLLPDERADDLVFRPGWTRLDDAPIAGRTGASAVSVDDRLFVFGGWEDECPPWADCLLPSDPPFADGAMVDLRTGEWDQMAEAPVGLRSAETAVVGADIYVLGACEGDQACPDGKVMLRYRSSEDDWDTLPLPADRGYFELLPYAGGVVAVSLSDENGEHFWFDASDGSWSTLPDDPLPSVYDRQAVDFDGTLMLFGTSREGSSGTKLAASLDPDTLEWTTLPESGTNGFQVWRSGDRLYLNPHFGLKAEGGMFDPVSNEWAALPDVPDADSWRGDMAGVIGEEQGTFEYSSGWILDTGRDEWIEVPVRPGAGGSGADGVTGESVTAVGPRLVVFGGIRWTEGGGDLLSEAWIWNAPPAEE